MPEQPIDSLTRRVDRLERESRRLKRFGAAGLIGLATLAVMGQAKSSGIRVVEAEHFVLRDSRGKARATLAVEADGSPRLTFTDSAGRPRCRLGLTRGGSTPSLALLDTNGMQRVELLLGTDHLPEGAGLMIRDPKGQHRANLITWADGQSGVSVGDSDGKVRALLVVGPDGWPELTLADSQERVRAQVSTAPSRGPAVRLFASDQTVRAQLGVIDPSGEPHLALYDDQHRVRALLEATRVVLGHDLHGTSARVLWSAP